MSIKFSEFIPAPKPITLSSKSDTPVVAKPSDKSDNKEAIKNKPFIPPAILLSDRNQVLSNGTYIQARRDVHDALKPIIDKLEMLYAEKKDNKNAIPSFRSLIEKNVPDNKKFSELLTDNIDVIKKGNFSFIHINNLNTIFDTLDAVEKNTASSEELTQFKTHYKDLKSVWDKFFNTKDNRIKFVFHLLNGIDLNDKLDSTIKNLSQSPVNQNADIALFTEQIANSARLVRDIAGNVNAYSQANHFEEAGLHKRALEMPDAFKEFTRTLSEIAANPLAQSNKEYVELLTHVHNQATKIMEFILPEIKKAIDIYSNNNDNPILNNNNIQYVPKNNTVPVASNPVVSNPVASNPVASNPVVSNPVASNPVASNPVFSNNVSQKAPIPNTQAFLNALEGQGQNQAQAEAQGQPQVVGQGQGSELSKNPQEIRSMVASDMQAPPNIKQMLDYLNQKNKSPQALLSPYGNKNSAHSPTSDDKELRSLQGLWDWADHSAHMKNKINAVNDIGQTMEEIAMSGSGRPNPEMVALSKRSNRLSGLKGLMAEVPKINKATQELEKSALEAQHAYMTGVNQIATQKLKLDIDASHMQSEQQKIYQKGLEKLGLDSLEISTNMMRNYTKVSGLFNEILMARIDIVWDNIKRLTRGFKF